MGKCFITAYGQRRQYLTSTNLAWLNTRLKVTNTSVTNVALAGSAGQFIQRPAFGPCSSKPLQLIQILNFITQQSYHQWVLMGSPGVNQNLADIYHDSLGA